VDRPESSLDYGTKLGGLTGPRWAFVLYPDAAEGGGSFRSNAREPSGAGPSLPDRDRSAADASRRARAKVRRYCAANRLNRLGTLTYAGQGNHDPAALRIDLAEFFRKLRGSVGERFPYVWAPEWHPGGHGLHAHFALGRNIHYRAMRKAWGRGFIDIRMLSDLPVGSGSLGEARRAARYQAQYVGKDISAGGQPSGLHRYEVAQGFQPRQMTLDGATADDVLGKAESYMGAEPEKVWRSRDEEGWDGPPAVWASWA
jgi:hypothetical protein